MLRNLFPFTFLVLIALAQGSLGDATDKQQQQQQGTQGTQSQQFEKRQGIHMDLEEDQLAMESAIADQVAVESQHQQGNRQPVPLPVRALPGSLVFPLPPGHQAHPGHVVGRLRAPPPQQQQQQQAPQGYVGSPSSPQGQQVAAYALPQQQPSSSFFNPSTAAPPVVSTPSGDYVVHKATEISGNSEASRAQQAQHGRNHQQQRLGSQGQGRQVPPHPFSSRPQGQGQPPPREAPRAGGSPSSSEITRNIIRELFERKPPGMKDGVPMGGFFSPPQAKVLNHPPPLSSNDLQAEGGEQLPGYPSDPSTPKITSLEVKCEKNVMRVFISFDSPFYGVIFSKGHYHNVNCIHLPAGLGHTSANFDISIESCGTQGNMDNGLQGYGLQGGSGSYFENTVVVQYDPLVQEVWDAARKLRCTWHDQYEKSVTFRPFPVDQLDVVRADFAGDNVGCWMQIQVGKGPWASEVSGLVKIGQTMTMVLAIKDDDNKFDMMVRNCVAHDGARAPIQLVDQWGCISRPKLMTPFTKIKNFGASATVLSFAHFQAFKFPDSLEVHFACTIQICRHQCPDQCTQGPQSSFAGRSGVEGDEEGERLGSGGPDAEADARDANDAGGARRRRRAATSFNETSTFEYTTTWRTTLKREEEEGGIGLNRVINVISPDDLDFRRSVEEEELDEVEIVEEDGGARRDELVCMSSAGFAAMITLLIGLLLTACIISSVIVLKRRRGGRGKGGLY